ncbi:hypothetical protein DPEC_G00186410 [Dallia pectoralis]|uniref:Uncharacterized protein n=1 Tax=Dallia pectoralis TaxID=75939 RepID=A0ACC2GBH9_DALPE|nr:hypothetical protein DPEC_G00186410 [Dallia pectoralis]
MTHQRNMYSLNQTCDSGISLNVSLHYSLIPSFIIICVLSALQSRSKDLRINEKLPFLNNRFGIVVPLDLIGSLSNRWSFGFAFGAVSTSVLHLFSENYIPHHVPTWANAFVYLMAAIEVGLAYFPFFACLSTPSRVVGAVLGILYSLAWLIVTLWDTLLCPSGKVLGSYQKIIYQWPSILSLCFILGRFTYMLVKAVRIRLQLENDNQEQLMQCHQAQHVQRLFQRSPISRNTSWFQRRIYEWDPYFKYPNRMIGTTIISLIGLYAITLADYSISDYAFDRLDVLKDQLENLATYCNASCNETKIFAAMVPQLEEFIDVARKSWLATTIFSSLTSVTHIFHVLVCYRKHLKRLWAGNKDFLPKKFHKPSPAVSVAAITRYSGWQIAFTLWGFLVVHFVLFVFAMLFTYGVILPIQNGRVLNLLSNLGTILLTIGIIIGLVILQVVLAQVFFLQDKISPSDKYKPLALNNRKAFHNFNYFFFFYNVVMGLSNCILRLLTSCMVGAWLISRIDRTIMQRGYESMDPGYNTWIGMIFTDHHHNNPVMVCFCHFLLSNTLKRQQRVTEAASYSTFSNVSAPDCESRARRRWLLLYTLMKNPRLILLRKKLTSSAGSIYHHDTVSRAWVLTSQTRPAPETVARGNAARAHFKLVPDHTCGKEIRLSKRSGVRMSDDQTKKMLRAVLQSNKNGVPISRLLGDYRSLTGECIPFKQLGYPSLEALLRSIPSVVRMDNRMGEIMCYAAVCQETAHIAQLVARQKSNKKVQGRSQMLNCRMRPKQPSSFMLYSTLRTSLRQPDRSSSRLGWAQPYASKVPPRHRNNTYGGFSAGGDVRKLYNQHDERVNSRAPAPPVPKGNEQRDRLDKKITISSRLLNNANNFTSNKLTTVAATLKPVAPQPGVYDPKVVQSLLTEVLKKYCSGLWLSKVPEVYRAMHNQEFPGQAVIDLENWTHVCSVEKPGSTNRADRLLYPPKPKSPFQPRTAAPSVNSDDTVQAQQVTGGSAKSVRGAKPVNLAPLFFSLRSPSLNQTSSATTPSWQHSPTSPTVPSASWMRPPSPISPPSTSRNSIPAPSLSAQTFPTPPPFTPPTRSSNGAAEIPLDVRVKLRELLSKYNQGLWAHALPKLYQETFKVPFPGDVLDNLCLLLDVCTVEYPMHDKKKAILYGPTAEVKAKASSSQVSPPGSKFSSFNAVPPLVLPKEEFPSVLVVEASSTTEVILRYIGEDYSQAQEAMEESMRTFYSQPSTQRPLSSSSPGQLAAVKVEGGEEVVRAQVCETMTNTVKVYYVDHGFSEVICKTQLMELLKDFLKLPFQASVCTLAGLEHFSSERSVLLTLESLAVGKILLAELLQRDTDTPQVVLYDTSLYEDVNVNAACLKALHDRTMENPLQVNSTYMNVSVTNVCFDGTVYCQLPSRGRVKLNKILEKIEVFFITQVTSDSLVSSPFCGKCCLARHKGKWARVEITNLHGSRVLDIQFVDLGVPASVEVIELREVPPAFLHELAAIPPQAIKCCLVDLSPEVWTPEAVLWLRNTVLHSLDCTMTISKIDEGKVVHIHLFSSNGSVNCTDSINHQVATSGLWKRPAPVPQKEPSPRLFESTLGSMVDQDSLDNTAFNLGSGDMSNAYAQALHTSVRLGKQPVLPPPMELPKVGQNMDVYVSVACHPGHFVLQPWQDLYKLVVLMGEMILYYNQREERLESREIIKGEVYAAKVDNNWHRVLVKAVLSNSLVSVYELDYGKHELVGSRQIQPLIESFRQLPFQGIRAQLAGVKQRVWSEAAAIVFRNHVEKKPLVAQVESVVEAELPWDRKVVVYLVDTSQAENDMWVHNIITDFPEELSTGV